jgi:K+-transporting ATPase ATPase C chain
MKQFLRISIMLTLLFTIYLGIFYPLALFGVGELFFPQQTNGSLIKQNKQIIGSRLLGQSFNSARYFLSRPSAAGNGYDPIASSGSNLGPTNKSLFDTVGQRVKALQTNTHEKTLIPIDLVTASGSGLDPDISPASAYYQAQHIAAVRGLALADVIHLIQSHLQPRQLGFLGEPRINVLELNLALDKLQGTH